MHTLTLSEPYPQHAGRVRPLPPLPASRTPAPPPAGGHAPAGAASARATTSRATRVNASSTPAPVAADVSTKGTPNSRASAAPSAAGTCRADAGRSALLPMMACKEINGAGSDVARRERRREAFSPRAREAARRAPPLATGLFGRPPRREVLRLGRARRFSGAGAVGVERRPAPAPAPAHLDDPVHRVRVDRLHPPPHVGERPRVADVVD